MTTAKTGPGSALDGLLKPRARKVLKDKFLLANDVIDRQTSWSSLVAILALQAELFYREIGLDVGVEAVESLKHKLVSIDGKSWDAFVSIETAHRINPPEDGQHENEGGNF